MGMGTGMQDPDALNDALLEKQVRLCFEELAQVLGDLSSRHSTLVVLAALSEELGRALLGCRESGAISAARVQEIMRRVEALVFADEAG